MNKLLSILGLIIGIGLNSYGQTINLEISGIEIDEKIVEEVESKISDMDLPSAFLIYENLLLAEYYENDSLTVSTRNQESKVPFRSFFYTQGDTLFIDGAYGLFGGFGFSIQLVGGKSSVYHLLVGDEFPTYARTKNGDLAFRVEVPCTHTRIILSKIPEPEDEETIYGMVEFESGEFYHRGETVDEIEIGERTTVRTDMKIYFKSNYLEADKE